MTHRQRFWYALTNLVGTIIGVGFFGLAFSGMKAGYFVILLYLVLLGGVVLATHLFLAEVATKTKGHHRLPGYAQIYLGHGVKHVSFFAKIFGLVGSLVAYLIIGGEFFAGLFNGSVILFTFIYFVFGAWLIWRDEKLIGPTEILLMVVFLLTVGIFFVIGAPHVKFTNLGGFNPQYLFIPYGIVLFSFWGAEIIPEMRDLLWHDLKHLRRTILIGFLIVFITYVLFSSLILGISGKETTSDAMTGLISALGPNVIKIGFLLGIVTTFTSFITFGMSLKKVLMYDYQVPKLPAWLLVCFVPLGLYIIGLKDYLQVVSLTGAIFIGIEAAIILLIYLRFKQREQKLSPVKFRYLKIASFVLVGLLLLGVVFEIEQFIRNL